MENIIEKVTNPFLSMRAYFRKNQSIGEVYTSLSDIKLRVFIDCIVDSDYSGLIKSGNPSQADLSQAWKKIFFQYRDLMKNDQEMLYLTVLKELGQLEADISLLTCFLSIIERQLAPSWMVKAVNEILESQYEFDPGKTEQFQKEINSARSRMKSIVIRKKLLDEQRKGLDSAIVSQGKGMDRDFFSTMLIILSDHAKYVISDNITAFEFCERFRRFKAHVDSINVKKRTHASRI